MRFIQETFLKIKEKKIYVIKSKHIKKHNMSIVLNFEDLFRYPGLYTVT